jgi:phage antirepressor YoqD-like protein
MSKASRKEMFRAMAEQFNEEKRYEFEALGNDGQYADSQKNYAFELIAESGLRATARILKIPRRTLQRWCRQHGVFVRRCPSWVYGWAERRRKQREFWRRIGYC